MSFVVETDTVVTVEGTLLRVKLQRADGWSPADVLVGGKTITAVGLWVGVEPGARIRLVGEWTSSPRFGRQFKFSGVEPLELEAVDDIVQFLAYRLEEIGPARAGRIKQHFGDKVLEILEQTPERLAEVPGLSERMAIKIGEAWKSYKHEYAMLKGLSKWGLTSLVRKKAIREWGFNASTVLEENPFSLMLLDGVGFLIADKAREMAGIAPNDPRRLCAGVGAYIATGVEGEGSTWASQDVVLRGVVELLKCTLTEAQEGFCLAHATGDVITLPLKPPDMDMRVVQQLAVMSHRAHKAESDIHRFVVAAKAQKTAPPEPPKPAVPPKEWMPTTLDAETAALFEPTPPPKTDRFAPAPEGVMESLRGPLTAMVAASVASQPGAVDTFFEAKKLERERREETVSFDEGFSLAEAEALTDTREHDDVPDPICVTDGHVWQDGVCCVGGCGAKQVDVKPVKAPVPAVAPLKAIPLKLPAAVSELPPMILELAQTDPVVFNVVKKLAHAETSEDVEALYEAVRFELDGTLRKVRDALLDYLREGDEAHKELFSTMVERLTAIAVVATHDTAMALFGRVQLEKPADWKSE